MKIPVFDKNDKLHFFDLSEVSCIRKEDKTRKYIMCTGDEDYYLPSTLKQYQEIFSGYGFYQIDKNKLINMTRIDKYENGKLELGACKFNVSRRIRKGFEDALRGKKS